MITVAEAMRRALKAAQPDRVAAVYLTDADHDELNRPARLAQAPVFRGALFSWLSLEGGGCVMV